MSFVSWFLRQVGLDTRKVVGYATAIHPYTFNGKLSIARDFSRWPAGRRKSDGPHSGQHLRELVLQRLEEGHLTIDFNGTMGYGSSFLQGAFEGLRKERPYSHIQLTCTEDPSIVTEVWRYINS